MTLRNRSELGTTFPRKTFGQFQADRFAKQVQDKTLSLGRLFGSQSLDTRINSDLGQLRSILERQTVDLREKEERENELFLGIRKDTPVLGGVAQGLGFAGQVGGTVLGGVLDLLSRPSTAVAGGFLGAQGDWRAGGNVFEGVWKGLTGGTDDRMDFNFATVLENQGVQDEWPRNILGLTADILLDPLNILGIGVVRGVIRQGVRGIAQAAESTRLGRRAVELGESAAVKLGESFSARFLRTNLTHVAMRVYARQAARRGELGVQEAVAEQIQIADQARRLSDLEMGSRHANDFISDGLAANGVDLKTREAFLKNPDFQTAVFALFDASQTNKVKPQELERVMGAWGASVSEGAGTALGLPLGAGPSAGPGARGRLFAGKKRQALKPYILTLEEFSSPLKQSREELAAGVAAINRFRHSWFDRMSDGKAGLVMAQKELAGVAPTDYVYMKRMFPSGDDYAKASSLGRSNPLTGSKIDSARSRVDPQISTQAALERGVETDVAAIWGREAAIMRWRTQLLKLVDDDLLTRMGSRRRALSEDQLRHVRQGLERLVRTREQAWKKDPELSGRTLAEYDWPKGSAVSPGSPIPPGPRGRSIRLPDDYRRFINAPSQAWTEADLKSINAAWHRGDSVADLEAAGLGSRSGAFINRLGLEDADKVLLKQVDEAVKPHLGKNWSADDLMELWRNNLVRDGEGVAKLNRRTVFMDEALEADLANVLDDLAPPQGMSKVPSRTESIEWIMPKEFAKAYEHVAQPVELSGFLRMFEIFNTVWKPIVTTGSPLNVAFWTRNLMGLALNSWFIGGMGVRAQSKHVSNALMTMQVTGADGGFLKKAGGFVKEGPDGVKRVVINQKNGGVYEQVLSEMRAEVEEMGGIMTGARGAPPKGELGLGEGRGTGFLAKTRGEMAPAVKADGMSAMKQAIADQDLSIRQRHKWWFPAWGRSLNETQDNVYKWAFITHRIEEGDDLLTAVNRARDTLYDYGQVGEHVRTGARVFPFIRWLRFNVPAQIEATIYQPQRASKFGLVSNALPGFAQALDPELAAIESREQEAATLPEWIQDRYHTILGKTSDGNLRVMYSVGAPIEDLNRVFALSPKNTFENIVADITPILRAPIEWAADHSFFTGQPIDDPRASNFYRRAWGWTHGMAPLREFLGIQEIERADGTNRYLSTKPVTMFWLAALVGRQAFAIGKLGAFASDAANDRFMQGINFVSGAKVSDVFPVLDERVPLSRALLEDPGLNDLYREMRSIPLYEGLTLEEGNKAQRAKVEIDSRSRMIRSWNADISKDDAFVLAAEEWATVDPEGVALVLRIRTEGLKRTGTRLRSEFSFRHPRLRGAIEGFTLDEQDELGLVATATDT